MRVAMYDRVEPPVPVELPFRLVETSSWRAAAVLLVLVAPAVLTAGLASLLLVGQALLAPGARTIMAQHPALGLELLAAMAVWGYLLGLPLKRLFRRVAGSRVIEVDAATVKVIERGPFRSKIWSVPLGSFLGVANHVRASLSGTRHELILVHPEREKSVLLSLSANIRQEEVERVAELLGHKEISPSALYRFKVQWPRIPLPAWRDPAHA